MNSESFLHKVAQQILLKQQNTSNEVVVILPNKRARVFLVNAFKTVIQKPTFVPQILSIEEFIQDVAGIRSIDSVTLLFEFFAVYNEITPKEELQTFEQFAHWAKNLIQDFNEIDRYLLDPNHVFSYLKDIEAIKRWNLNPDETTQLIQKYLHFWEQMPHYYSAFYAHLLAKGNGYQGLIYREAVENLQHFTHSQKDSFFLFAGFNALNQAEEKIVQHLLSLDQAQILWDTEEIFLTDSFHDAGYFARKIKKNWSYYKSHPYQWIFNAFQTEKNIQIIGTPKTIGQAKIVGNIVENLQKEQSLDQIAIVLGEENMLIPLLHSLPDSVSKLNITMGFPAKSNPVQILISNLFKLHHNAVKRNPKAYVFYYKDILDLLQHALVEPYISCQKLIQRINQNNYTFITHHSFLEISQNEEPFFSLLFSKWPSKPLEILDQLLAILLHIKAVLKTENENDRITLSFLYSIYKVLQQLKTYCEEYPYVNTLEGLYALYKQSVDLAEVSFEGEPLEGLQIMGVLESRVLDFKNVIITSLNEGIFPAGKSQNSYIPLDVKRELGLPTYKEKDAIYTYHFYHLLQRAQNIFLLYNTESEGLDAGEKSRFITQIEVEKHPNHNLSHQIYNAILPEKPHEPMIVEKSEKVVQRLREMAENGFSPSTLTTYIRNPIQFYLQRILKISEVEEVEESIAANTFGTIIHGALEALYRPFLNQKMEVSMIEKMLQLLGDEVAHQFKKEYREGEISKGKNLLAFEVAKRNVFNYLQLEKRLLQEGDDLEVLFLEQNFEFEWVDNRLPFPIKIKGNVDRIERRNGVLRIIDYKTGKVEQSSLSITYWDELTSDIKNDKIIQLLCYALMIQPYFTDKLVEIGIISFKNLKAGFMPFQIKEDKKVVAQTVDAFVLSEFQTQLAQLILEIFNTEIPFEERIV